MTAAAHDDGVEPLALDVPSLASTWWAVADGRAPERMLRDRLPRAIQALEAHELDAYDPESDWWFRTIPSLSAAVVRLNDLGIVHATATATRRVPSGILVSWAADLAADDDPDDTVAQVLAAATAAAGPPGEAHLVLLTDRPAPSGYHPPRRRGEPRPPDLPTRAPDLPPGVDALTVVHRTTGRGWAWDGDTWAAVPDRPTSSG